MSMVSGTDRVVIFGFEDEIYANIRRDGRTVTSVKGVDAVNDVLEELYQIKGSNSLDHLINDLHVLNIKFEKLDKFDININNPKAKFTVAKKKKKWIKKLVIVVTSIAAAIAIGVSSQHGSLSSNRNKDDDTDSNDPKQEDDVNGIETSTTSPTISVPVKEEATPTPRPTATPTIDANNVTDTDEHFEFSDPVTSSPEDKKDVKDTEEKFASVNDPSSSVYDYTCFGSIITTMDINDQIQTITQECVGNISSEIQNYVVPEDHDAIATINEFRKAVIDGNLDVDSFMYELTMYMLFENTDSFYGKPVKPYADIKPFGKDELNMIGLGMLLDHPYYDGNAFMDRQGMENLFQANINSLYNIMIGEANALGR